MADDADITADRSEREYSTLLLASVKPAGPVPNGHCHWCDEPVAAGLRFCDSDCAQSHAKHSAAQVRNRGARR